MIGKKLHLILLLLFPLAIFGATNTASTSGAWETGTNWSLGHAPLATEDVVVPNTFSMTVNNSADVCLSLTINATGTVTIVGANNLSIAGNFSNAGTFTANNAGSSITFNAASNAIVSGSGTYTIAGAIVLNTGSLATTLDVTSTAFCAALTGSFTLTQGTWIMDNAGTIANMYTGGSVNQFIIPNTVCIQSNNGTMYFAKAGTQGNVLLEGELYMNGGNVYVAAGQGYNAGVDFQYHVIGGIAPILKFTSGNLYVFAGFNWNTAGTDYINFNMSGGTLFTAYSIGVTNGGYSNNATFCLQDVVGGLTVMTGGTIILQDADNSATANDLDMGGANVAATLYSVTGGTVQFGYINTQASSTFYGITPEPATNYPNFSFQAGAAKSASPYFSAATLNLLSLTVGANMTFDISPKNNNINFISTNGTYALSVAGTLTPGTGSFTFSGSVNQLITSSIATETFPTLIIANTSGATTTFGGSLTTISTGGLTLTSGNLTPGTVTIINITGNTLLTSGTFTAPTTINQTGSWTNNGGTFTPGTNTINFVCAAAQTLGGTAATTFYTTNINNSAGITLTGVATTTVTVNDLNVNTGNFTGTGTLNVNNNVTLTGGTFTGGTTTNMNGPNWINNGGTFTGNGKTVNFLGTTAQTINGTAVAQTFSNINVNLTPGQTLTTAGSTTTLTTLNLTMTSGNFTAGTVTTLNITGSTLLTSGSFTAPSVINQTGSWTNNGGTFNAGTNTINFVCTANQNLAGTAATTFYITNINNTAGFTLTGNAATTVTVYDLNVNSGNFTGTGTLNVNDNVTLIGGTFTGGTNTNVYGPFWTNNGGTFTGNGKTVTFFGTAAQTINGTAVAQTFSNVIANLTAGQLLTTGGSTVTLTTANLTETSGNITAPATLNINGTLTLTAGTLTVGAVTNITGNWTNNGGTFVPGTNVVNFTGAANESINGTALAQTFYDVVVNLTAGKLLNTGGSTVTLTVNNLTETTGNLTGPATLNINANVTLTAGTFTAGTTINMHGANWTNNGGTFTPGANTVNFSGTASQTINGTAVAQTFGNVVANLTAGLLLTTGGSTVTLTTANLTETSGNITAPATLNINGTLTLTSGTFTVGAVTNITGNWINNGGTFVPGTNVVNFIGAANESINGTALAQTFYNVVANLTVGKLLNTGGSTTTLSVNNFTETTGNFTAPAVLGGILNINANVILTAGTFTQGGAAINILGNWTDNGGVFTGGAGTITFNGTTAQTIGGTSVTTFSNFTLNNTSTGLTLTSNEIISGVFTFSATNTGLVNLSGNTLTIGTSAAVPGSITYPATLSGWIYGGTLTRWMATTAGATALPVSAATVSTTGFFPIGSAAAQNAFEPFWFGQSSHITTGGTISLSQGSTAAGSTVIASYSDASWAGGTTVNNISNATWVVSAAGLVLNTAATAQIMFGGNGFQPFVLADINVSLAASTVGTYVAPLQFYGATDFEVERTGLTLAQMAATWHIGTTGWNSPLPIELTSFTAECNEGVAVIKWSTASENNNKYFTVEKTQDGMQYNFLAVVNGNGSTDAVHNYSVKDPTPFPGTSYYRLSQTDFDGNTAYFNSVPFESCGNVKDITAFVNSSNDINIHINSAESQTYTIEIINLLGQTIVNTNENVSKGLNQFTFPNEYDKGVYFIRVSNPYTTYTTKILILK